MKLENLIFKPSNLEKIVAGYDWGHITRPIRGWTSISEIDIKVEEDYYVNVAFLIGGRNGGYQCTFVHCLNSDGKVVTRGYTGGFQLPVPESDFVFDEPLWQVPVGDPLILVSKLPGFEAESESGTVLHKNGWYTKSFVTRKVFVNTNFWGEGTQAYTLREGVYLTFLDGTSRLVPFKEYYSVDDEVKTLARQGDCLITELANPTELTNNKPVSERLLDRHFIRLEQGKMYLDPESRLILDSNSTVKLTHPEHDELIFSTEDNSVVIGIAPGTSYPFRRSGSGD